MLAKDLFDAMRTYSAWRGRTSPLWLALLTANLLACGSQDGSAGPPDRDAASNPGPDATTLGGDGGADVQTPASPDAGTPSSDAGGAADTGSREVDASPPSDGGRADAGPAAGGEAGTDAGAAPNPWLTFDPAGVVSRSNIILNSVNSAPSQLMPVGNGKLGAAVWAAGGFTAQLNRTDTLPDRKSPGWLTIPGLAPLTTASDFHATLDLYNAVLKESGGGMTATIYVRADSDELIVDVTGADPNSTQTATVSLWSGRKPQAAVSGAIGTLAESWTDGSELGNSGLTFGSLAAVTAGGRSVKASAPSTTSAAVTFQPNTDGTFRVICASPSYNASTAAATLATTTIGSDATATTAALQAGHLAFWHDYWGRVGLVEMSSTDGSAEYVEALRTVYLYVTAAEMRGVLPGTHAGIADLFNFSQDHVDWDPQAFWFWNLRMDVAANMSSGAFDMNAPVFNLYASNVANMETWTLARMGNRPGICLPETMRFNGNGWYQSDDNQSCDQTITPTWNSMNTSSGAEVGLWVWQQYLMTGDMAFLRANYPVMQQAATFLLAFATQGSDGLLHTTANAHESQWDVTDPTTNIAAMRALFPATVKAAQTLGTDATLVAQLQAATPKLPPFRRTDTAHTQVLTSSSDATDIFAFSTQPTAQIHNSENIDLEPVFPYNLITDLSGTEFTVAQRTYSARRNKDSHDWPFDPVHAARLDMATEVAPRIAAIIKSFQAYAFGLAAPDTTRPSPSPTSRPTASSPRRSTKRSRRTSTARSVSPRHGRLPGARRAPCTSRAARRSTSSSRRERWPSPCSTRERRAPSR